MSHFEKQSEDNAHFPAKTYADEILEPIFDFQRDYLYEVMLQVHSAHSLMLHKQNILTAEQTKLILTAICSLSCENSKQWSYQSAFEDLFFMMEDKLGNMIGKDLAGNMHIAKSRNDMGVAMYRMVLRQHLLALIEEAQALAEVLLYQAEIHKNTVMPAYTHTQPAQPTTFGHYLIAILDVLNRDIDRLWHAYDTVNQSPLGAAALSTTGFRIDRLLVAELLGFSRIIENSYDAVAGGDYLLESATSVLVLMTNTGRWVQDFLQGAMKEFAAIRVSDAYVQISSIMPQKRNPVSLEHARSLASSSVGEAHSVLQMIHNTPYGDIVDTEDDLQPHLYKAYEKASRVLRVLTEVIRTMEINKKLLEERAGESCITITELADVLTREKGVPFRTAHHMASGVATYAAKMSKRLDHFTAAEVKELLSVPLSVEEWRMIVSPLEFVKKRSVQGGPAPCEVERMCTERREGLRCQRKTLALEKERLQHANDQMGSFQRALGVEA
ncbi:argininosuccinate lyase [Priestia koreensis]|uniref:Argininosuccinate lyase n=1 Tax=Priestia koreensis TaxID=284581 RepID=A0A0M0L983_9BACI|nr:argininosuccinate lyase [Priestia koreensis]KOO47656.1 argininosuccinate lyase [Priestia koreensis]